MNRLNLRHNWPLWTATAFWLLTIMLLYPAQILNSNHENEIVLFREKEGFDYWSLVPNPYSRWVLFLWLLGQVFLLAIIIRAIYYENNRRNKVIGVGLMLVANASVCVFCTISLLASFQAGYDQIFQHIDSADFNGQRYHITYISRGETFDLHLETYAIIKCDSLDSQCRVETEYEPWYPEKRPHFIVDHSNNVLYLELDGKRDLIAP